MIRWRNRLRQQFGRRGQAVYRKGEVYLGVHLNKRLDNLPALVDQLLRNVANCEEHLDLKPCDENKENQDEMGNPLLDRTLVCGRRTFGMELFGDFAKHRHGRKVEYTST